MLHTARLQNKNVPRADWCDDVPVRNSTSTCSDTITTLLPAVPNPKLTSEPNSKWWNHTPRSNPGPNTNAISLKLPPDCSVRTCQVECTEMSHDRTGQSRSQWYQWIERTQHSFLSCHKQGSHSNDKSKFQHFLRLKISENLLFHYHLQSANSYMTAKNYRYQPACVYRRH